MSLIEAHAELCSLRSGASPYSLKGSFGEWLPSTPAGGASTAADLRRLRRAPGRGSLCLCMQCEASGLVVRVFECVFVRSFVCLFVCLVVCVFVSLFVSVVGWLFVCMCACLFFAPLQQNYGPESHFVGPFCVFLHFGGP